jgi:hypothetical protein
LLTPKNVNGVGGYLATESRQEFRRDFMAPRNGLKIAEGEHDQQLRPFEKTDWYGWAGAEKFEDGSEPLIAWVPLASWPDEGIEYGPEEGVKDAVVIVDQHGISVNGFNASFDMPSKGNKDAMIQTANDVIRNGPIDYQRLLERGFVPVNFPNDDGLKPKTAPVTAKVGKPKAPAEMAPGYPEPEPEWHDQLAGTFALMIAITPAGINSLASEEKFGEGLDLNEAIESIVTVYGGIVAGGDEEGFSTKFQTQESAQQAGAELTEWLGKRVEWDVRPNEDEPETATGKHTFVPFPNQTENPNCKVCKGVYNAPQHNG